MRLVGLSGSLRAASYNSALLRAAQETAPPDVELIAASIHGIPLYDGDLEAEQGLPEAVVALKDLISDSDGLMLFTPEYNNSIPGPFKNAIDAEGRLIDADARRRLTAFVAGFSDHCRGLSA